MPSPVEHLSAAEQSLLLRVARDALTAYVEKGERISLDAYPLTDTLKERHGAFVTLRRGDDLRGCIGYTRSVVSLAEAVRDNAINAATRDPRFPPVSPRELPHIHLEISALGPGAEPGSPFIPVHDIDDIVLGRDGLYLDCGNAGGGLLLPQVPTEQGWGLDEFLDGLCRKAGVSPGAWQSPRCRLYRFTAQVIDEERHQDDHGE